MIKPFLKGTVIVIFSGLLFKRGGSPIPNGRSLEITLTVPLNHFFSGPKE